MMDFLIPGYILTAAFVLDLIVGDPRRLPHPVRWMGASIAALEPHFRRISANPVVAGAGYAAFLIVGTWLLTLAAIAVLGRIHPLLGSGLEIVLIFFCLSARSLEQAAMEVHGCLVQGAVDQARQKVALIVGRDVDGYDGAGIARAAVETVAENLVDGVISPLFFAAIGGAPLAMAYKMVNTLDSMVGYKNEKYQNFGKAAARIDDVLNYIPSRFAVAIISLATHILGGKGRRSLETAVREGANHSSPNAGFPEAAFAGALGVKLNGPNYYAGKLVDKPYIGINFGPSSPDHIKKACDIMLLSSFLWLMVMWGASVAL
jgi:adenosylcobinamide-phosphate synthase